MSDIFISYAREDRETAQRLAKALEAQGWSVWWDTRLKAGEIWDDVIARELAAAHCVIVLWSKTSVQSHWVQVEAGEGLERRILVPVRIENVQPPLAFRRVQAGDLIGWKSHRGHPGFKNLMADVTGIIGPPSQNLVAPPPIEEPGPEPARPASDDGPKCGKIATFLKNAWPEWFKHFVATIKHHSPAIADRRPRKRHLAMAGGISLLVAVVVGYSFYKWQPEPQPPDRDDKPPESQEVACHDQEAVNSLVNRLGRAKETYDKNLIDIINYNNVRQNFVKELNQKVAQGRRSEECISQALKIFRSLYDRDAIDIIQWNNSKRILWNNIHNLLVAKATTDDEIEQALTVINDLYRQDLIDIIELNKTTKALSDKIMQELR